MKKKFGALRVIGTIYKIVGVIIGIVAILGFFGSLIGAFTGGSAMDTLFSSYGMGNMGGAGVFVGILSALVILIGGGLSALVTFGIGELFYLFISMEENTRATAAALLQSGSKPQA
ncbi:MAG TPA: hypothetical protein VMC62_00340 [Longilinea sp.]|nr:hypothetical protein [Longilinea sp.]